ncbi:MAG: OB-fold domain-containing protein [Pseudomonadota bacterium]
MTEKTGKATSELQLGLTYDHGTGCLQPYFDGLSAGHAIASKCPVCGKAWFPPQAVCPDDRAETGWSRLPGSGAVVAVTTTRTRLPFTAAAEVYTFVLVAMDGAENAVFGRMQTAAEEIAAGMRVDLVAPVGEPAHPAQAVQFVAKAS